MQTIDLKQKFLNLSIEKKLRYSSIFITSLIIVVLSGIFLFSEYTRNKHEIESDLKNNSRIIAENISGALIFDDLTTANEILDTLKAKPKIIYAAVFDNKNRLFSAYKGSKNYKLLTDESNMVHWTEDSVLIRTPVIQKGEHLGNVLLVYTQEEFKNYMHFLLILTLVSVIFAIFIANMLFRKVQNTMIQPLLELTSAMQKIRQEKNFSIRIQNASPDEIGILSRGFNKMIAKIEEELEYRNKVEKKLKNIALYDQLTRLPNRHYFHMHLEETIQKHSEHDGHFALLFIDLDGFKNVNDTLGHDYGDLLLQEVAQRLNTCVRKEDFVARLGGDEFTIILEDVSEKAEIAKICDEIIYELSREIALLEKKAYISGSIGVARFRIDSVHANGLMQYADLAMYHAKENGKNDHVFYDKALNIQKSREHIIETELRSAIQNSELSVVYQPKVDLQSGTVKSMEALIRWNSKKLGFVSPAEFIPIAERSSLIIDLENWVIDHVCAQLHIWNTQMPDTFRVAINISQIHFKQKNFLDEFNQILQKSHIKPEYLEIELTESVFLQQTDENIQKLYYLQSLGIEISIDDFGTGYSSLSYLKQLPINAVKIDKSFIDGLPDDADDVAITKTIIDLSRRFELTTIAEGVENKQQVKLLREMGCNTVQGYYYSKPLSAEDFEKKFVVVTV